MVNNPVLLLEVFTIFPLRLTSSRLSNFTFQNGSTHGALGNHDFGIIAKAGLEFHVSQKVSFQGSFFTSNNVLFKNDSGVSISSYGFVPTVQYYFINKPKFTLFGQLGYGFGFEDLTRNFGTIENSALTIFSVGAGVNYKLNNKLHLQLHLPYFNAQNITINETSSAGVAVFLGFNFKLN